MPGHDTTNTEYRDRISKTKEILMRNGYSMSAIPEICSTFKVSRVTAWRYKNQAEKEINEAIELSDEEAVHIFIEGLLEVYHATGSKGAVKLKALDMLAKFKGLYKPRKIEVSTPLADLDDEALGEVAEQLGLGDGNEATGGRQNI
jgi:hypothetical protein